MDAVIKRRKSVVLTRDELQAFREYVYSFRTHTEAAEALNLNSVNMVSRALTYGSASPETVAKIKAKINY